MKIGIGCGFDIGKALGRLRAAQHSLVQTASKMFPFPPGYKIPSGRRLQHLFEAQHNVSGWEERSEADRSRDRKALLVQFANWELVKNKQLDPQRGEDFRYTLSGNDPFQNFQRSTGDFPHSHRDPYEKDAFGALPEDKKRELRADVCAAKAKYRKNLMKEYSSVFDIQGLPREWMQSNGTAFGGVRDSFHKLFDKPLEDNSLKPSSEAESWTERQLLACQNLKSVLNELVEIVCCGPKMAEVFDDDDTRRSVCKHASRALTPVLLLCSNAQLRNLLLLLGAWDEGEERWPRLMTTVSQSSSRLRLGR